MRLEFRALVGLLLVIVTGASPQGTVSARAQSSSSTPFRPPSVPLVTHDPYFSVWSPSDRLSDSDTRHWTGRAQTLRALIRVDGKPFRLMGRTPSDAPALPQTALRVLPTRTIYNFQNDAVAVTLTFTTPALPTDIEVLSRPVTYVTFDVRSRDRAAHAVQIYADASPALTVNDPATQAVRWSRPRIPNVNTLRIGSDAQPVLQKKGDDLRIDWGYLYVAAPAEGDAQTAFVPRDAAPTAWATTGKLAEEAATDQPRTANDAPVAALSFDLGGVGEKTASRWLMLAYDDLESLTYMRRPLKPFWRRNGMDATTLLQAAARDYPVLQKRCADFDTELMADLRRVGGDKYAQIAALAHRQALAANKIVADANGAPLMLSKENFSNGCIATVDVLYPAAPQLLLLSPTLAKASLVVILNYAASPRWKFPFAPHDVGTYPRADGQVYGGGERTEENQMPVEETGNMLILLAAIAKIDGDTRFSDPFWPQISRWAAYLEAKGFDPESQLSTDDFAGHLAHNVNLSAKAIEALGAYSILCAMRGDKTEAARVRELARSMAERWVREAGDGDHTRLAFDRPGTWSLKYNLVWDRVLGLNFFPKDVLKREMAFYRKNINAFGVPLDNRETYTKLDWTIWTAMLTGSRSDFEAISAPAYAFLSATPNRNPMSDWYQTKEPRQVGFQARSVVGGVFLPVLGDSGLWKKWTERDRNGNAVVSQKWAALPTPPQIVSVVAASEGETAQTWRYTTEKPSDSWSQSNFNDGAWRSGPGGFGTRGTPSTNVRTVWNTSDIWLRREFTLPADAVADIRRLQLFLYHDEDAEIYINGVLAAKTVGYNGSYDVVPIHPDALATLKPGKNVFAVHCHQTTGGQYIDVGLALVKD